MMTEMNTDAERFLREWFAKLSATGFAPEVFLAGLSPDLVWTATGKSPLSGTFHGLAAYLDGVYRPLDERLRRWPDPAVERITAQGDWGVVEFRGEGGVGKNGCDYSMRYCWSMRVENNLVRQHPKPRSPDCSTHQRSPMCRSNVNQPSPNIALPQRAFSVDSGLQARRPKYTAKLAPSW